MSTFSRVEDFSDSDRENAPNAAPFPLVFLHHQSQFDQRVFKMCLQMQRQINENGSVNLSEWNTISGVNSTQLVHSIARLVIHYPFIETACSIPALEPFWIARLRDLNKVNTMEEPPFITYVGLYHLDLAYDYDDINPIMQYLYIAASYNASYAVHTLNQQDIDAFVNYFRNEQFTEANQALTNMLQHTLKLFSSFETNKPLEDILSQSHHVPAKLMLANYYLCRMHMTQNGETRKTMINSALACVMSAAQSSQTTEGKAHLHNAKIKEWPIGLDCNGSPLLYQLEQLDQAAAELNQRLTNITALQTQINLAQSSAAAAA